jgi:ribosomal protein L35
MKGMKTNKAFLKRLKVSRNGKITARKAGQNHFNAKEARHTQMNQARTQGLPATTMTPKVKQRYIKL